MKANPHIQWSYYQLSSNPMGKYEFPDSVKRTTKETLDNTQLLEIVYSVMYTELLPIQRDGIINEIIDKMNEKNIFVCRDCFMSIEDGYQCNPCRIAECGCGGDIRCCGYDPQDI